MFRPSQDLQTLCFNSILVRLKAVMRNDWGLGNRRFNSILVRLKGTQPATTKSKSHMFQFHTGSIKRIIYPGITLNVMSFQFHTGSIKSPRTDFEKSLMSKFQFHTGSIKSYPSLVFISTKIPSFNSILVRLKEKVQICFMHARFKVSIPYWFD